ncbi:nitrogenase molybdenum-iron protein NifN [Natranaerovirga pectinivora]|uniref:Nitrogenase molybdenum-iron protein NifN n=1 Tax=Natranaerovirga pectinivora TaxID=682400 RepID=A0A4R3MLZ3_9FIRM|nr:nitrogenase component 1 [Natranaerovirga pectinivora]TCT15303.1 nitrogenase molybdenum-iron protein NifN [Natranaerovirga pectinivora]
MSTKKNFTHLNVNPCKMCMPMGGSLAFKGIERSMILIHGSQGCSTYIRRHISAHYNEPVDIASSSLTEEGTVYGGTHNLKKGLRNLIALYNPSIIGVLTTCLAETIGEDIQGIIREFLNEENIEDKISIVPVSTPGYNGSQYEGYYYALRQILENLTEEVGKNDYINIVVSNMTCEDIRELKRLVAYFQKKCVIFPDISDTLDAPYTSEYNKLLSDGTKLDRIKAMGGAVATIEFGEFVKEQHSPGKYLEDQYNVPLYRLPIPVGLENSDTFINILSKITNKPIPNELQKERGRMLDGMIDSHKYNGEGIAAVFGDPEMNYAIASLCIENGINPRLIMTGTKSKRLKEMIITKGRKFNITPIVMDDSDFSSLQPLVKENDVNILIGNSDGKFIKEKEHLPLIRVGFPIHDHMGAQRKLNIGYKGSLRLLDEITNTLIDLKHDDYRDRMYKNYFEPLLKA